MLQVLGIVAGVLLQDHEVRHTEFQQLPYHRIFIMLFIELNAPEHVLESINFQVLTAFWWVSNLCTYLSNIWNMTEKRNIHDEKLTCTLQWFRKASLFKTMPCVLAGHQKVQDIFLVLWLTITMIIISHTFLYKIVLKIFKVSGHLSKKIGQWPMTWREQEQCHTCLNKLLVRIGKEYLCSTQSCVHHKK